MFYLINETLTEIPQEQIKGAAAQYVAVLSSREWALMKDSFDMGIDIEPDILVFPTGNGFPPATRPLPLRWTKKGSC